MVIFRRRDISESPGPRPGCRALARTASAVAAALTILFWLPANAGSERCLTCHTAGSIAKSGVPAVDMVLLAHSVHAALTCGDCHHIVDSLSHKGRTEVYCGQCHQKAVEGFNKSPHVQGRKVSVELLPTCVTCHGGHGILAVTNPESRTSHKNSPKICISCHENRNLKAKFQAVPEASMIRAYESSIHGQELLIKGNAAAPACVNCHGSHSFMPADDPESPVNKAHIAATCGKCHDKIASEYDESVHGTMLAKGVLESPTCTSCHGEHDIRPPADPLSRVSAASIPKTCNQCHGSEAIVGKYGLRADRIATFKESFHGAAIELGETRAANCASCHGVHNIYPQTDPRSLISRDNIKTTCGKCHEGLPEEFAQGTFHASAKDKSSGGKFYVRKFYIWFISILIILFVAYRMLEYKRRVRRVE